MRALENKTILAGDPKGRWCDGVMRVSVDSCQADALFQHLTSPELGTEGGGIRVGARVLNGFSNWSAVHAAQLDPGLQGRHTLLIGSGDRSDAPKHLPGLRPIVRQLLERLSCMGLHGSRPLDWLTGHVLNQGDENARFDVHQDTTEEQEVEGGAPDRKVIFTVIIKLSRGGTTSMQVCGEREVYYRTIPGSGLAFRSALHHRTCRAEVGVWKLALFFGHFL